MTRAGQRGYVLLEATIAYTVLALALVSLLPLFILSLRANAATQRIAVAAHLSAELMEEIAVRKWDEKTPVPAAVAAGKSVLGLDAGEVPADKKTFDDIDDFAGYTESPPQDPVGKPIAGLTGYSRDVAVSYVDESCQPSSNPTDFKKVTVCTRFASSVPICVESVFTNR